MRLHRSLGLFGALHDESLVDVGDDTTTSDGGLDEGVELFVSADGQLEVARSDSLDFQIFASVASQFQHLGSEVLEDGRSVDSRGCSHARVGTHAALQESVDPTDGELEQLTISNTYLQASASRSALGVLLVSAGELATFSSLGSLSNLNSGVRTAGAPHSQADKGRGSVDALTICFVLF